jgi:hypothetical protein
MAKSTQRKGGGKTLPQSSSTSAASSVPQAQQTLSLPIGATIRQSQQRQKGGLLTCTRHSCQPSIGLGRGADQPVTQYYDISDPPESQCAHSDDSEDIASAELSDARSTTVCHFLKVGSSPLSGLDPAYDMDTMMHGYLISGPHVAEGMPCTRLSEWLQLQGIPQHSGAPCSVCMAAVVCCWLGFRPTLLSPADSRCHALRRTHNHQCYHEVRLGVLG